MVKTASTMLPLDTRLPFFDLPIVVGTGVRSQFEQDAQQRINSSMFLEKPLLIMIICAHCPFVKYVEPELTNLDRDYSGKVDFLAVSSNSLITHPEDNPENLLRQSLTNGWGFPYVFDFNQTFAKSLMAACTPDFFLFSPSDNGSQKLRYRGQLDSSRPGNDLQLNGSDLRLALDLVLSNQQVFADQKPSLGCNIKWDPDNQPNWFV